MVLCRQFQQRFQKGGDGVKKQIIGLAVALLAVILIWNGVSKIPGMRIKAEKTPEKKTEALKEASGTFEAGSG